jgi:hypothetical protein
MSRYSEPEFAPYVTALGQFALAWNELQASLCELFSIVALERPPLAGEMVNYTPTYIWHSIKSDRAQREMLEAAIKHSRLSNGNNLSQDGLWLAGRVGSLEDRRNDILHSPLIPLSIGKDSTKIVPNKFGKNPRAEKLDTAADLLEEIQSARDNATLLSDYAQRLVAALLNAGAPWPNKPSLQGRRPKGKMAGQNPAFHK